LQLHWPVLPVPIFPESKHKFEESILPDLSWLREGSESELRRVANSRELDFEAVSTAQDMGLLRFGEIRGLSSWILTNCYKRCAEGRRLNGKPYPACKTQQNAIVWANQLERLDCGVDFFTFKGLRKSRRIGGHGPQRLC
jgi:hypothetical protein